jgi:hypothetical protein
MTFADFMIAANEGRTDRNPGQWTRSACKVWQESDPEVSQLLEAAITWEVSVNRYAQPTDETEERELHRRMDEATTAR